MQNSDKRLTLNGNSRTYDAKYFSVITGCLLLVTTCCVLHACTSKSSDGSPKFQQYFVQGEQLYLRHCSNCHQKNGKGLGLIYPPLDSSDYMEKNFENVLCMMRHGKSGELIVNGESYNQSMPGVPTLSDLEIAEIATYIYNSWNHDKGIVDVKVTSKILSVCDSL
ncbi:MAG TPA: cytochrome c [Chryseolinea sp.]|jgi:cytochrome c|nr:cytochrome c [Chryseolinea sp.]